MYLTSAPESTTHIVVFLHHQPACSVPDCSNGRLQIRNCRQTVIATKSSSVLSLTRMLQKFLLLLCLTASVASAHNARRLLAYDKANLQSDLQALNINFGDVSCAEVSHENKASFPSCHTWLPSMTILGRCPAQPTRALKFLIPLTLGPFSRMGASSLRLREP